MTLEEQHSADLKAVSLNTLVVVKSFVAEGKLGKMGKMVPSQVLWYKVSMDTLKMASEMHKLHHSNLILSFWAKRAACFASESQPCSTPVPVTLKKIYENIWKPLQTKFCQIAVSIASGNITLKELDQVLMECGDQGDEKIMRRELSVMSETLSELEMYKPEKNWMDQRLRQIQEYRQLGEAAAAASAILRIAEKMKLSGNFTEIATLTQLVIIY